GEVRRVRHGARGRRRGIPGAGRLWVDQRRRARLPRAAGEVITMKTEKQKMLAGEYFDPLDPELCADRSRARRLTRALNASRDDDVEVRACLLADLLPGAGGRVWIEPPFHCDYGSNIETGERVFFNFDCVVLDVGPVRIG